jgi:hypothetical protein
VRVRVRVRVKVKVKVRPSRLRFRVADSLERRRPRRELLPPLGFA